MDQQINYKQKMLKYLFKSCDTCDELVKKYPDLQNIIAEANMYHIKLDNIEKNCKGMLSLVATGPSDNWDEKPKNEMIDIIDKYEILSKEHNLNDSEKRLFYKCIKYSPNCMYYPKKK